MQSAITIEETDSRGDEPTGRTAIAQEAIHEAHKAQMGVIGLKRRVSRISWVWTSLAVIAAIFAAGFAFREALNHYATTAQVAANTANIERLQHQQEMNDEHQRMRDETVTRMAKQIDGLYDHLMRGQH